MNHGVCSRRCSDPSSRDFYRRPPLRRSGALRKTGECGGNHLIQLRRHGEARRRALLSLGFEWATPCSSAHRPNGSTCAGRDGGGGAVGNDNHVVTHQIGDSSGMRGEVLAVENARREKGRQVLGEMPTLEVCSCAETSTRRRQSAFVGSFCLGEGVSAERMQERIHARAGRPATDLHIGRRSAQGLLL